MDTYVMMETSYESDDQFLDNMAEESLTNPDYMTEEDHEEEEVVLYEAIEDIPVNTFIDVAVGGMTIEESRKARRSFKKALVDKVPNIPTSPYFEHQQEKYRDQLANHFNRRTK